jgi:hypothetical protein
MEPTVQRHDPAASVDVRTHLERHAFACGHCGERWIAEYELREYRGPSGASWIVHCRDGRVVRAPSFGDVCPACAIVSVTPDPDHRETTTSVPTRTSFA